MRPLLTTDLGSAEPALAGVEFADRMHFVGIEDWSPARISELVDRAPRVDLTGVRVYVVGGGATGGSGLAPRQIEGIQRLWIRWFEGSGATVEFYGAKLARFPIAEGSA